MTSAYILVAAVLILGGVIAALGDRLGSKVGKARLRLFNLRPKQTAVLLTVLTGILIAASTLGVLFTLSKSLREGVFRLDDILKQLRSAQADLDRASRDKSAIEAELKNARRRQAEVQQRSKEINANYVQALGKLRQVLQDSRRLQGEVKTLTEEQAGLRRQKEILSAEAAQLQAQVKERDRELDLRQAQIHLRDQELQKRQSKIAQQDQILAERQRRLQELAGQRRRLAGEIQHRDRRIAQLDRDIASKDGNLRQRERQLQELEQELAFLNREVETLERYYQDYQELRERQIALVRGQVLAFGAFRVVDPAGALQAVDELLRQANRNALKATRPPGTPAPAEPIVLITKAQVEQLARQLQTGEDYVVRVLSAGNYVQNEQEIRVFADVAPNRQIFREDEAIATISMDRSNFSEEDIQKRLEYLLAAAQFRARREGVLGNIQVEDGRIKTLIQFVEDISQTDERPDEIRVVAAAPATVAGPLRLRLVALKGGTVIFQI
ncbi:MAG: DUF3084 domain-containing protein [Cyanobacteria bacterium RI_101]|nr:DUF3084 domain-containing protein [Cyanobacteria bacterium RI_101]